MNPLFLYYEIFFLMFLFLNFELIFDFFFGFFSFLFCVELGFERRESDNTL